MLRWAFTQFNNVSHSLAASGILSSRPGAASCEELSPNIFENNSPACDKGAVTSLLRWRAEVGTLHFVSCLRHARVPMPGTESGQQRQPRHKSRSPAAVPVLRREGLVRLAPRRSRTWCCRREAGSGDQPPAPHLTGQWRRGTPPRGHV